MQPPSPLPDIAVVVPCYDEAERLDADAFQRFAEAEPSVRFVMVDDGSRDATLEVLHALAARAPGRFEVLEQRPNRGKAQAVRAGMLRAFELDCAMAGYWDADLATPLAEIRRFAEALLDMPERLMICGARVQLLGRSIERSALRHYLGRVFATAASALLDMPIYDTQCGAKLFRVTPETRALFAEPFVVGWTFDVELIARLAWMQRERGATPASELIYELPLQVWHDVAGSKVSAGDFVRALYEMNRIRRRYSR
jgi:dolichyl-phosphate beta-glucosyltransferase